MLKSSDSIPAHLALLASEPRTRAALLPVLLVVCSCTGPAIDTPPVCEDSVKQVPVELSPNIDILFVIDNAASMQDERESLSDNLSRFINVLENVEGGLPSVHIGVVSGDLGVGPYAVPGCTPEGDGGVLTVEPQGACVPPDEPYLSDIELADGTRARNYQGSLDEAFSCIARLPADGCQFSQPLEAMVRALSAPDDANGFLREHAYLHVVLITDQDDCSVADTRLFDPDDAGLGPASTFRCFEHGVVCDPDQPEQPGEHLGCTPRESSPYVHDIQRYVDFLKLIKDDPGQVTVSVVSGGREPVRVVADGQDAVMLDAACDSMSGRATPGVRLDAFAASFPQRNNQVSICEQDLSEALLLVADRFTLVPSIPCIEGEVDLDPVSPGLQLDCTVSDVYAPGTDVEVVTPLPECASVTPSADELPCWRIDPHLAYCPETPTSALLDVHRGPEIVPEGMLVEARCVRVCGLE